MPKQIITKTDFRLFLDTPLHFWAFKHGYIPTKLPSAMDDFRMQQGQQVEALAQTYIAQTILPKYTCASHLQQVTFTWDCFLARMDALIKDETENIYDLYEIKSSSSIDKEDLLDVAFQVQVCRPTIALRYLYLVYLNKTYRRQGELNLKELFLCEDISEAVTELAPQTQVFMQAAQQIIIRPEPQGIQHCRKPDDCPFPELCHPDLPEHPIYEISRLHRNKAMQLEEMGVRAISAIPADFKLSGKQAQYVEVVKSDQPYIDRTAIQESLATLQYPLHFLDYETCNPALPSFDGYHPNQHIVFQFSLHVQPAPGAGLEHYEYLHSTFSDPAPTLLQQLAAHIAPQGNILVWNKAFEMTRNCDMAEMHPEFAPFLENVNARIYDLMEIFSQGLYIHPDFHGSASIKKVLPVLVSNLSYDDMDIKKGDEASIVWWEMVNGQLDEDEKAKTITAMLEYCSLDTLALVRIHRLLDK
ncbi:MAG: DUF2779 domain-containing protein [Chloroflexi bacterium]|nr:DUF2779 domain-containing protein [Chloroflexota bacterium]